MTGILILKESIIDNSTSSKSYRFRCSKYRHPDGTWTHRSAVKSAYDNMGGVHPFHACRGVLFVEHTGNGILSFPQLLPPYHECGCLNTIPTINLGYHDDRPALELISPTQRFVDVNTSERRQGIIDELELSSMSIRWSGLTGGNFVGGSLRHFVLNLSEQHAVNSLVERVMAALVAIVQQSYCCSYFCLSRPSYRCCAATSICPRA